MSHKDMILDFLNEYEIEYNNTENENNFILPEFSFVICIGQPDGNIQNMLNLEDLGYDTFTIFPWNNINKVIHYLTYKLKIKKPKVYYARKLKVYKIDKNTPEINKFIDNNHILGKVNHPKPLGTYCFLDEWGNLLGVATFIKNKKGAELKRMVFDTGISVVGGASKLLKAFEKEYPELTIITYSDRNISQGRVYGKIGFEDKKNKIVPQEVFYHPETFKRFSVASLWMIGADRILAKHPNYVPVGIEQPDGPSLPGNEEIVESYGFIRYKDCGNRLWIKEK